ncbi:MAG: S8 family serine peptidase [Desulfobacterales bacterium]|nr:S8 family serine peptidase [Desulfobacterales bacterium]
MCNILNLKVLDDEGIGTEEEVVLAIDDCINMYEEGSLYAPDVMNLSLGAPDDGNPNNPLRVACRAAIEKGIWVMASAGNGGPAMSTITSPACERYVGAVGSVKYEPFQVSTWSSRGPTKEGVAKPDAVFFGEDIVVASSESDTATVAKSGTSFSTPFISGLTVLYHEGVIRRVQVETGVLPGVTEKRELVSLERMLDEGLPIICVKPQEVFAGKDYDYGYGMPWGTLVAQEMGITPAVDISYIVSIVTPFLVLGMMGMVISSMTEGFR